MNAMRLLLCLLLCSFAAVGCTSNNDPAALPTLGEVFPTGAIGFSGAPVNFSVEVAGVPPFFYQWNFGAGATADDPTVARPLVTLNTPGDYVGSVSVRNQGGTVSKNFAYTVRGETSEQ